VSPDFTYPFLSAAGPHRGILADVRVHRVSAMQALSFSEHRFVPWLLAAVDGLAVQASIVLAHVWWNWMAGARPALNFQPSDDVTGGLMLMPLGYFLAGLYPGYGLGPVERLQRRVITAVFVLGSLVAWDSLANHRGWPRGTLILPFLLTLLSPALEAVVISILIRVRLWGTPAAILSGNHAGITLARTLRHSPEFGLVPVALFNDDAGAWGTKVDGLPVLGPPASAGCLARSASAAVVVLTPGLKRAELIGIVEHLPFRRMIVVPELGGLQSLWVRARDLGGSLGLELTRNLLLRRNYYVKRVADYALGLPLFLISVPIIAILALWIKRVSPGPAFYTQVREGLGGKPIRIWKLRTMYVDADRTLERYLAANPSEREHWKRFFKLKSDPRILPGVGTLLRRTSLDELPQLWNVLRGELSLVGPRPFPGYHMASFGDDFRNVRRSVLPGITGLWQVGSRSDGDLKVQEQLDTYYIRNWSPWLDTYILARTALVVLMHRGAY
jgi:Undecaprenyl-phosphate galactose phosphotransferase WbaP